MESIKADVCAFWIHACNKIAIILNLCRNEGLEVKFDEHFWEKQPNLQGWPEICQELTRLKQKKINEGIVTGPFNQVLNGAPTHGLNPLAHLVSPPADLCNVNSPGFIPGNHVVSAESSFLSQLEQKEADEMAHLAVSSASMGPMAMEMVIKRLQRLLLQKVIEVSLGKQILAKS